MKTIKNLFALLTLVLLSNIAVFAQLSAGGGIAGATKLDATVQSCTFATKTAKGLDAKIAILTSCLTQKTQSSIDISYYKGLSSGMVISGMRIVATIKGLNATEVEWTYKGGGLDATEVEWTYDGGADLIKLTRIGK